jgi:hypothetical protein
MLPKDYTEFQATLQQSAPPANWPDALKAMWFDAKGDWESSHNIAQDMQNELGSWLHAYLHRKEGDRFNAGYWYRQAGRSYPEKTLEQELREIVEFLL